MEVIACGSRLRSESHAPSDDKDETCQLVWITVSGQVARRLGTLEALT